VQLSCSAAVPGNSQAWTPALRFRRTMSTICHRATRLPLGAFVPWWLNSPLAPRAHRPTPICHLPSAICHLLSAISPFGVSVPWWLNRSRLVIY
jgi:hypothetical protein